MAGNPNLQANRQVCNVLIRKYATGEPFLYIDTANQTGLEISGDTVAAMAKGRKRIVFANPYNNTVTLEAQVFPLRLLSLLGDGTVKTDAVYSKVVTLTAGDDGLTLPTLADGETAVAGSYYCYKANEFGNSKSAVEVTIADGKATAAGGSGTLTKGDEYEICFMVSRATGSQRIELRDDVESIDLSMEMETLNKNDKGEQVPTVIKLPKVTMQRSVSLSFASEGDPASLSLTFDVLTDASGKNIDIIQY